MGEVHFRNMSSVSEKQTYLGLTTFIEETNTVYFEKMAGY